MFSSGSPEITPLTRRTQRRREGRGESSAPSRPLRLLRGLRAFVSAPEITPLTRRTQRKREGRGESSAPSRPLRLLRGLRAFVSAPEITPLTRRTQRKREGRGGSSAPSRPPRRMFSSGFPEITPLTRRTRRKLGTFAACAPSSRPPRRMFSFGPRVPVPENSPSGAGRPLWRLAVEFEVGDQAFVALDAVILLAAVGLFLDQQDVGVGGGEDAEVARAETDLGELFPERGERGALAGVDQLDQAFRGDAGLGEALLVGGERGGFGGGRLLARPGALGELAAVLVVARFEALQQHRGRHLAGVDPLLGARPGLDEEMAHRRHRDLGKARGADRRAPAPLFQRAGKFRPSPVIGGGRRRRRRRGGAEIDIVLFAQPGKLAAVLRLPLVAVLSRHDIVLRAQRLLGRRD